MVLNLGLDELKDLPLASCHAFSSHAHIVQAFDRVVKHLFVEQMFALGLTRTNVRIHCSRTGVRYEGHTDTELTYELAVTPLPYGVLYREFDCFEEIRHEHIRSSNI